MFHRRVVGESMHVAVRASDMAMMTEEGGQGAATATG